MDKASQEAADAPLDSGHPRRSRSALKAQFALPHGPAGRLAGWVMAKTAEYSGLNPTVLELLALSGDDRVLEIGFGPGEALRLLAEGPAGRHVAGVDPSPVMLARARRRNRRAVREGRMDLRLAAAEALPWPDGSFEAVFAVNTAQLWTPIPAGIAQVSRVLTSGGRVVLALHQRCVAPDGGAACVDDLRPLLEHELAAANFTDLRTESRVGRGGTTAYIIARAPG